MRIFTFIITLMAVLTAISNCGSTKAVASKAVTPVTQHIEITLAGDFHDVPSLKHASDLVIHGTITGVADRTIKDVLPFTDFTVSATDVLYDPFHSMQASGGAITLHQTGGTINNTTFIVDDDPLFVTGEEVVLFLHQFSPGHYYVLGGPAGRYEVKHGTVAPINDESVPLSGSPSVSDFIASVQQIA